MPSIDEIAEAAATDVAVFNQEACLASRFIFVEGERAGIEKFCARLQERLGVDRETASEVAHPLPVETREEIEMLQVMDDECKVWGKCDGRGLVILTERAGRLPPEQQDGERRPRAVARRRGPLRERRDADRSACTRPRARQRCATGWPAPARSAWFAWAAAAKHVMGGPHDAMFPLQRFVHWMSDEDA